MPWPLTAPMFHRSMTPKRATRREQARDVAGAILWMSQLSNVRPFFRNGESQRNCRPSPNDLSTILLKFAITDCIGQEKADSLIRNILHIVWFLAFCSRVVPAKAGTHIPETR